MAKRHSGGPGVSTSRGVSSTMGNATGATCSTPSNNMGGAFSKPHDLGNGGIPTIIYDRTIKAPAVPKPNAGQNTTPILGGEGGQQRPRGK